MSTPVLTLHSYFLKKVSNIPHTSNIPADCAANSQLALVFMASLTVGGGFSRGTCRDLDAASTPALKTSFLLTAPPLVAVSGCWLLFPSHRLCDHQSTTTGICHLDGVPLPPLRVTGNNRCKTEWQNTRHRTFECWVRYHHTGGPLEHKYQSNTGVALEQSSNSCKTGRCPHLVVFMSAGILYEQLDCR